MALEEEEEEDPVVDNSITVVNKIANLYAERLMSDVTLVVGNAEFPSHRLILCASSDVFQIMLMNPSWTESQETRVVLRETPSSEAVFEDFLKYFYTGKILLDYATVIPIVSLADKYNVKDLLRLGLDYMTRNVSTACKRNQVISWFQFTYAAGHQRVQHLCRDFIKANFQKISENIDFPNMELDSLVYFLNCNDLVIDDELSLFHCVDNWLQAQREILTRAGEEHIDLHMNHLVQTLLPYIRFPMMTPSQLADLLLNPLSKSHMELLVEKIRLGMSYHKGQIDKNDLDPRFFTPRLYTTERFCATFSIDHLPNLPSYHCRSLHFSSQRYMAEQNPRTRFGDEKSTDWMVDVYPKGVWVEKCLTVYRPPGLEVPGKVIKTVRVAMSTREARYTERRVKVGVLLHGEQDGFLHVRKVLTRNYIFSDQEPVLNFDHVLDFDDLHNMKTKSPFLSGKDRDALKISVVVTPLNKLSSLEVN